VEYVKMLKSLAEAEADCNVSLKLSQLGLSLDAELARENLVRVLEEAQRLGNFVRIDMEGSAYTQKTLDLFYELFPKFHNLGVVIQANLRRSEEDVKRLVQVGARVRLVKGAYKEPPSLAFEDKAEVNANYDKLARLLISAPMPAFATHDEERIKNAVMACEAAGLSKDQYEIQMLYGLKQKSWRELAAKGHTVRIYVPYGTHWFPYYTRRLRERKENIYFLLRNLFS
jgi:proline dehydrogenase